MSHFWWNSLRNTELDKFTSDIWVDENRKIIVGLTSELDASDNEQVSKIIEKIHECHEKARTYSIKIFSPKELFLDKKNCTELLKLISDASSVRHECRVLMMYGGNQKVLFTYNLENLDHVQKTLFGYALKGRDKRDKRDNRTGSGGILGSLGGETSGRNGIIIPSEKAAEIEEFLEHWKVKYFTKRFIEIN